MRGSIALLAKSCDPPPDLLHLIPLQAAVRIIAPGARRPTERSEVMVLPAVPGRHVRVAQAARPHVGEQLAARIVTQQSACLRVDAVLMERKGAVEPLAQRRSDAEEPRSGRLAQIDHLPGDRLDEAVLW